MWSSAQVGQLCGALAGRPEMAAALGGGDRGVASRVLEDVCDVIIAQQRGARAAAQSRSALLLRVATVAEHQLVGLPPESPTVAQAIAFLSLLDILKAVEQQRELPEVVRAAMQNRVAHAAGTSGAAQAAMGQGARPAVMDGAWPPLAIAPPAALPYPNERRLSQQMTAAINQHQAEEHRLMLAADSVLARFVERPTSLLWVDLRDIAQRWRRVGVGSGAAARVLAQRLNAAVWRGPFWVRGTTPEAFYERVTARLTHEEEEVVYLRSPRGRTIHRRAVQGITLFEPDTWVVTVGGAPLIMTSAELLDALEHDGPPVAPLPLSTAQRLTHLREVALLAALRPMSGEAARQAVAARAGGGADSANAAVLSPAGGPVLVGPTGAALRLCDLFGYTPELTLSAHLEAQLDVNEAPWIQRPFFWDAGWTSPDRAVGRG